MTTQTIPLGRPTHSISAAGAQTFRRYFFNLVANPVNLNRLLMAGSVAATFRFFTAHDDFGNTNPRSIWMNTSGPDFSDLVEKNLAAFALIRPSTGEAIIFRGPNAVGVIVRDLSEPYTYEPPAGENGVTLYDFIEQSPNEGYHLLISDEAPVQLDGPVLTGVAGDTVTDLEWTEIADADGYERRHKRTTSANWGDWVALEDNTRKYRYRNLNNDVSYDFQVRATKDSIAGKRANKGPASNILSLVPREPPPIQGDHLELRYAFTIPKKGQKVEHSWWTGSGSLNLDGVVFKPGTLINVSDYQDTGGVTNEVLQVTVAPLDSGLETLLESDIGIRDIIIYWIVWHPTEGWQPTDKVVGTISDVNSEHSSETYIISVKQKIAQYRLFGTKKLVWDHATQKDDHEDDDFFIHTPRLVEGKEIGWPN